MSGLADGQLPIILMCLVGACRPPAGDPAVTAPTTEATEAVPPAVSALVARIDTSVDPCVDFAAYACGPAPSDGYTPMDHMFLGFDDARWAFVTAEPGTERPHADIRRFVAACRNAKADPGAEVTAWLAEIGAIDSPQRFMRVAGRLQAHGTESLWSAVEWWEPTRFATQLRPQGTRAQGDVLGPQADPPARAAYVERIAARLTPSHGPGAAALAERVAAFEARLVAAMTGDSQQRSPEDFDADTRGAWSDYLESAALPAESPLTVTLGDYARAAPKIVSETEPEVLRAYLEWSLLDQLALDLPSTWALPDDAVDDRPNYCTLTAERLLDWHMYRALGRAWKGDDHRREAQAMIEQTRAAIIEGTRRTEWLPPELRDVLVDLQTTNGLRVGWLDEPWGEVPTMGDSHVANVLAAHRFRFERLVSASFDYDQGRTGGRPLVETQANAWNDPRLHAVDFSLAILQSPVFDPDRPRWMNIASLGMIAAHELHHSDDPDLLPIRLEKLGLKAPIEALQQSHDCLAAAYEREYPQLAEPMKFYGTGGSTWIDETANDIAALRHVYPLFEQEREAGRVVVPPGVTPEQLYFVSYVQYFCNWSEEEFAVRGRARIQAAVAGVPEFAEAFSCAPSSPAVLEHSCDTW